MSIITLNFLLTTPAGHRSPRRLLPHIPTDRIAQRAFRIRKKVYHLELETNAIEAADKIRDMADSNSRLMKMVEKLQRENKAVSSSIELGEAMWAEDMWRRGG
jgi:hypothetical protein